MHEGLVNPIVFLTALLVLIVAAKIGAEIAERLGQPSVLGEIVAGILVGATGFGAIVRGVSGSETFYRVFSLTGQSGQATYQALDVLAEIGVIVLLFEIGLHSDLYELRRVGKSALWVGVAGVVLPFVGGYAVASYVFHLAPFSALFIGAALTATSVGITARVFRDLNLLHTPESQVVLGAAVADDVIGLIILAVISALSTAGAATASAAATATQAPNLWLLGGQITLVAVGFLVAAIWIGVKSVPLIDKIMEHTRSRGAITVLGLAFCLLISLLSQQAKLAPIVGAFAGGLVLSHCNKRREIQDGIKPLADIFIPLFFAMMGTVVDLRVVVTSFTQPSSGPNLLVLTAALVVVGVVGKVAGCLTVPDKSLNKWMVGLGMIPRGEVGLIFARLGIQTGILTGVGYDGIVLTVLLTTLMTPPLLRMAGKRIEAARVASGGEPRLQPATSTPAFSLDRSDWEVFDVDEMLLRDDVQKMVPFNGIGPLGPGNGAGNLNGALKGVTPPLTV